MRPGRSRRAVLHGWEWGGRAERGSAPVGDRIEYLPGTTIGLGFVLANRNGHPVTVRAITPAVGPAPRSATPAPGSTFPNRVRGREPPASSGRGGTCPSRRWPPFTIRHGDWAGINLHCAISRRAPRPPQAVRSRRTAPSPSPTRCRAGRTRPPTRTPLSPSPCRQPVQGRDPRLSSIGSYTNPVLDRDFPDPNVIRASDGWCYAYATQALGERPVVNIQVARSRDLVAWEYLGEALPQRPPWAQTTQMLWAPHVVEHDGVYVMAYSAAPDDPPYPAPPDDPALCLALAVSDAPAGPFIDVGAPLHCGPTTSDIDPCVFRGPAGGGRCCYWGSGGDIVVQELAGDLRSFAAGGRPRLLLRGWSADPPLPFEHGIEGPFLVERDGWYHLWYSGDRTWTYPPHYATMVARGRAPGGPFARRPDGSSHFVLRDNDRWRGPGHNSVIRDDAGDDWVVYHAIDSRRPWLFEGQVRRVMLIDRVDYVDGWPVVGDGTPSVGERPAPFLR